jgi:2-beta-glucuronyltransferase
VSVTKGNVVFLSAFHDYRTAKKASIQQVADGLVRAGYDVSFVSTRFSHLSKLTGDSRMFLWDRANRVEDIDRVHCYLWRTLAHPFASRSGLLNRVMNAVYPLYARSSDRTVDAMLRAADHVIIESSVAAIFLRHIRSISPRAKIIYYATDRLDTVGAHPFIRQRLIADAGLIDHVCLRSPKMMDDFAWAADRLYRAEFGVNANDFDSIGPSPYTARQTAVSVGSMLFDADFFQRAAPLFPEVQFHVIGCGMRFDAPANVVIHDEMRFRDTLPYVKHATVGIAPYRPAPGVEYLAESSLKMAQYELLALPAVCPDFAVGDVTSRSGYCPGDAESMAAAMRRALGQAGTVTPRRFLTWDAVAERVLRPQDFPGTKLTVEA